MNTAQLIYKHYQDNEGDSRREHLGGSLIGRKCERMLWYSFRWATMVKFDGRILRLFQRGHREEPEFIRELMSLGAEVHCIDTHNGQQYGFKTHGGHFAGSYDGVARYLPGIDNNDWHLLEFKTHGEKSYGRLLSMGMEKSKPEHYGQMQVYMHHAGLAHGLYMAVNKNDDSIYTKVVEYDEQKALRLVNKARHVITAAEPPPRCSEDPTSFDCKYCDHAAVCHGGELPEVNCRTCAHSTPELDGDQRWSCDYCKCNCPGDLQRLGCDHHVYIPALLPWELLGGSDAENYAEYRTLDGSVIRNSNVREPGCYTSKELKSIGSKNDAIFKDNKLEAMRQDFSGFFGEQRDAS